MIKHRHFPNPHSTQSVFCCGYGNNGLGTTTIMVKDKMGMVTNTINSVTMGYDCLQIPGLSNINMKFQPSRKCGRNTLNAGNGVTSICSEYK